MLQFPALLLILYVQATAMAEYGRKEYIMSKLPENLDYKLAKIWLDHQDLSNKTPEEVKVIFFEALHKIEKKNVERWD